MHLTSYDIECLHAAKDLMLKDISIHHTIEQIATFTALSPSKLKKGFRQYFRQGLFEYLETQRLERAKELMYDRDKSLKQISSEVGFHYLNNFSRAFKKKYGMPPTSWRNTLQTIFIFTGQLLRFFLKLSNFFTI